MKKSLLLGLFFISTLFYADAQQAKRYVTIEHFTNSVCGICASRNPAFFNTIEQYPDDVHHIAIHPPVPYTTCLLYRHNPNENAARASYYNIPGTPRVVLNGQALPPASMLISSAQIEGQLNLTSPIGFDIDESDGSDSRTVKVRVKSFDTPPTGNLKLYVAVVEKRLNYASPNGESVHHNVFRKFLANGEAFTAAANGEIVEIDYTYDLDTEWVPAEIEIMAFIQNDANKEILNSGTSSDPGFPSTPTSTKELSEKSARINIFPNPTTDVLNVDLSALQADEALFSLKDIAGKAMLTTISTGTTTPLNLKGIAPGLYFLNIQIEGELLTKKVVIR